MTTRALGWLRHPRFAPVVVLASLGWGTAVVAFLLIGPNLGGWARAVLEACFAWDAGTRAYRLDTVLLVTLEPPLFIVAVALFYADELRAFFKTMGGRAVGVVAVAGFLTMSGVLVAGAQIRSGAPLDTRPAPLREARAFTPVTLDDHTGRAVALGAPGTPAALTFVYADCHATCPMLVSTLKATEALLGDQARFLAVTLNPEADTREALADYADRWALGGGWSLLTGSRETVDALTTTFGVRVERRADGEIGHSNLIVLLDRAGRIAYTYRGTGQRPEELAAMLRRLASEPA
jgi:cytochrome oxidase Cu insertion factor (SCO1/SenC/PrrC family)